MRMHCIAVVLEMEIYQNIRPLYYQIQPLSLTLYYNHNSLTGTSIWWMSALLLLSGFIVKQVWICSKTTILILVHIYIYIYIYKIIHNHQCIIIKSLSVHLTHLSLVQYIYVSELVSIGSGNGLSHVRHQAISWNNADLLSIGPPGTNLIEIWIKIQSFSFMKKCGLRNGGYFV